MKIDFIVISGILVIISFLPFILLPILGMKDHKHLLHSFKETAFTMGLNISYKLQWNTNIAGIDILKRQFLFIQKPENDLLISRVNLNEVNELKLVIHNWKNSAQVFKKHYYFFKEIGIDLDYIWFYKIKYSVYKRVHPLYKNGYKKFLK